MGFSKLNVWIRDERCKPFKMLTDTPNLDWVEVDTCTGETIDRKVIPFGEAHVEFQVPPGCYVVHGHVCEAEHNDDTERAMVVVGCAQEVCVNLIVPKIRTCARRDLAPFVRQLTELRLAPPEIARFASLMLRAGGLTPEEIAPAIEQRLEVARTIPGETGARLVRAYEGTLRAVRA